MKIYLSIYLSVIYLYTYIKTFTLCYERIDNGLNLVPCHQSDRWPGRSATSPSLPAGHIVELQATAAPFLTPNDPWWRKYDLYYVGRNQKPPNVGSVSPSAGRPMTPGTSSAGTPGKGVQLCDHLGQSLCQPQVSGLQVSGELVGHQMYPQGQLNDLYRGRTPSSDEKNSLYI